MSVLFIIGTDVDTQNDGIDIDCISIPTSSLMLKPAPQKSKVIPISIPILTNTVVVLLHPY